MSNTAAQLHDNATASLRLLVLEDNKTDAELLIAQLKRDGLDFQHKLVSREVEFRGQIVDFAPHIILSDFTLPQFDGLSALRIAQSLAPSTPFVFVSGTIGEERAVAALKSGASDYVLKENLTRLVPAIRNAIRQAETSRARDLAEDMLRRSQSRLQGIIDTSSDWIWECDVDGLLTFSSPSVREMLGYEKHQLLGKPIYNLLYPEDRTSLEAAFANLREPQSAEEPISLRWLTRDGTIRHLERNMVPLRGEEGRVTGYRGIDRDVTERKRQEMHIMRLHRSLQFLSGTNSAIVRFRQRRELLKEACRLAVQIGGYAMATVYLRPVKSKSADPFITRAVSRSLADVPRPPSDSLNEAGPVADALTSGNPVVVADLGVHDGPLPSREAWLAVGLRSCIALPLIIDETAIGVIQLHSEEPNAFRPDEYALLRQVTGNIAFALQHLHNEENARFLEYFDPKTSLANRALFSQRLERMMIDAKTISGSISLQVMDISGLAVVNDGLGHHAGDLLLQLVAERLKNEFRDSRRLCHLGAGRFAVACVEEAEADVGGDLWERVGRLFAEPFSVNDQELHISFKAGHAQYPADASGPEILVQRAESALDNAKRSGQVFLRHSPELSMEASARLNLMNRIRRFAAENLFNLAYQPTLTCASGEVEGVEALLRWPSSASEPISPNQFIPILESLGLIDSVGSWVMRRALTDVQTHLLPKIDHLKVAVNVSPLQLRRVEFVDEVLALMAEMPAQTIKLVLEVTESTLLTDPRRANEMLTRMRDAGAAIAIDDFGTGHSSLKLLSRLSVDILKIDKSFVRDFLENRNNYTIVRTTLSLARSMGLRTVAEGVETAHQLEALAELGCDVVQGYYILPPSSVLDVASWLTGDYRRSFRGRIV